MWLTAFIALLQCPAMPPPSAAVEFLEKPSTCFISIAYCSTRISKTMCNLIMRSQAPEPINQLVLSFLHFWIPSRDLLLHQFTEQHLLDCVDVGGRSESVMCEWLKRPWRLFLRQTSILRSKLLIADDNSPLPLCVLLRVSAERVGAYDTWVYFLH